MRLAGDVEIRVADAPSFIATKLEAFLDRGAGDYLEGSPATRTPIVLDRLRQLAGLAN